MSVAVSAWRKAWGRSWGASWGPVRPPAVVPQPAPQYYGGPGVQVGMAEMLRRQAGQRQQDLPLVSPVATATATATPPVARAGRQARHARQLLLLRLSLQGPM